MHTISKKIVRILCCHFLYRVRYWNFERLEQEKKCLICPSHSNIFDPTFLYPKVDNLSIMAKAEIFKNKLLVKIWNYYGVFPVNREKIDVKSTMHALKLFENTEERRLLIFPEGGILKKPEEVGVKVKNGAVFIAAEAEVPIIPVYITRGPKLFSKVDVIVGKPMYISKQIAKDKTKVREKSKELIRTIYQLKEGKTND